MLVTTLCLLCALQNIWRGVDLNFWEHTCKIKPRRSLVANCQLPTAAEPDSLQHVRGCNGRVNDFDVAVLP